MDLLPTDEQQEIVNTVAAQLSADFALSALAERDWSDSVIDDALWRRCAELGWFALGLSEADGGIGYGLAEEALLFEQLGAHATPGPFLATVLAAHVAALAGESELVSAIASGTERVALAEPERDPDAPGPMADLAASQEGSTTRVRVTDHGGADLLVLVDGNTAEILDVAGLELTAQASFDPLVPLATAVLPADRTERLRASVTDSAIGLRATVLTAAELAGIARATAEQSAQYVADREQFGRPVGSFQAVKHRCADMAVRADAATQLSRLASLAVSGGHDDAIFQAEAARVTASNAAITNSEENVQNHGGIGFTYEHTAHRFVTRARVRSATTGGRTGHLRAMLAADAPS